MTRINSISANGSKATKKRLLQIGETALWITIFAVQIWLIVNDISVVGNQSGSEERRELGAPVAKLYRQTNDVHIQNPSDVLWLDSKEGDSLYSGQMLLTLDQSSADVSFVNGIDINLSEKSLIQIQNETLPTQESTLTLKLLRGAIHKKPAPPASVTKGVTRLQVGDSEIIFTPESELKASPESIEIIQGEVEVHKNGTSITKRAGESVQLKEVTQPPTPPVEVQPPVEAPAPVAPPKKVEVKSAPPKKVEAKKVPPKTKLAPPSMIDAPEIKKIQKSKPTSWLDFFISSAWAEDEETEVLWNVHLKWHAVEGAHEYRIQFSKKKTFQTVFQDSKTKLPEFEWLYRKGMENSKGRVFYRIASVDETGEVGDFSPPLPIEIPAEITQTHLPTRTWSGSASVLAGSGIQSQSSDTPQLKKVENDSFTLNQKLAGHLHWARKTNHWSSYVDFSSARFRKASGLRYNQPNVFAYNASLTVLYWKKQDPMHTWKLGGVIDRSFRWMKSTSESVESHGAYSIGPALSLSSRFQTKYFFLQPDYFHFRIALPLSGYFMSGHAAVSVNLETEWKLFALGDSDESQGGVNWIGLPLQIDYRYSLWKEPNGTHFSQLYAWLGFTFHFSEPY